VGSTLISTRVENMNLQEQLAAAMQGTVVVMGIGNPCRGDDAAGSLVARKISDVPGVHVIDAQDVPENYLCQVAEQRPDTVVLIDSVDLKSAPGSVAFLDKDQTAAYWPSTHRVPISLLMNYLERETPTRVLLIAIQPCQTAFLRPMSAEVCSSVEAIAGVLKEVIAVRQMPAQTGFTSRLSSKEPT
jgi:hydrogenase maturation protease HycI